MLHDDLLAEAKKSRGAKAESEATYRRAASSAYYAVFHRLTYESARQVFPADDRLAAYARRGFVHTVVKDVANKFARRTRLKLLALDPATLSPELVDFATRFPELQLTRHEADYDHSTVFTYEAFDRQLAEAEKAFEELDQLAGRPDYNAFLAAILLVGRGQLKT